MLKRLLDSVSALGDSLSSAVAQRSGPGPATPGPYIELLDPIAGSPDGAGVDLTYEDEYEALRDQVAKRGDIDDSIVQGNAIMLLRTRGKDLRAAVFLAYSTLRVDGLDTSLHALGLLCALLEHYGVHIHPRKPAARRSALEWLCNERFVDPLGLQAQGATEGQLLQWQATVERLTTLTQEWPQDQRPDLSGLHQRLAQWLDAREQHDLRAAVGPQEEGQDAHATQGMALGRAATAADAAAPKSAQEAWAQVRRASSALRTDAQWSTAGRALLRASRWASLAEPPPHQAGVTRFPGPRKEARNYLSNLQDTAQWAALLDECTRVFNEGSQHLWLDLMHWSDMACAQLGAVEDWGRAQLALDVHVLLARLPLLPTLKFEDGTLFASAATQAWLEDLVKPRLAAQTTREASPTVFDVEPAAPPLQAVAAAANKALRKTGLGAALALLQADAQHSGSSQQRRFEVQGLMLDLARQAGRADLALGLARHRAATVEEFSLARWSPDLAFDAWADLHALLRAGGQSTHAEALAVYGRLCGLNAARAASL